VGWMLGGVEALESSRFWCKGSLFIEGETSGGVMV
jgi:hypothetical protein